MAMKSYIISGKASYAKVLGAPVPGYDENQKEWTVDLILDEEGKQKFLESGADKFYIKENKEGQEYVKFTRKAVRMDGTSANPIPVVGPDGKDWDQEKLIGNGSQINVRYALSEVKSKGTKKLKPVCLAIQIWEHVPYTRTSFPTKSTNIVEEAWA